MLKIEHVDTDIRIEWIRNFSTGITGPQDIINTARRTIAEEDGGLIGLGRCESVGIEYHPEKHPQRADRGIGRSIEGDADVAGAQVAGPGRLRLQGQAAQQQQ